MPVLCHFYGYTPEQFYDLTLNDSAALLQYMHEWREAERKAHERIR